MAQHDYNIANQTGLEFRTDLNNALSAVVTQNSGTTEPAATYPGMYWLDTSVSPPVEKRRNQSDDGWDTVLTSAGIAVSGAANAAAQRTALGLVIGTNVQAQLVSGTNIKTVNSESLLGSGDIVISAGGVAVGTVIHVAQNTAPTGYLKANGALVNRTTYADLFAAIGTTFGAGNGSTTFALPDLRGEFIRGWDDGRGVDTGRAFGSAQSGANAPHTHGAGTYAAASDGAHTHTVPLTGAGSGGSNARFVPDGVSNTPTATSSGGAHTHSLSGSSASEGTEARPRNVALLACIKF